MDKWIRPPRKRSTSLTNGKAPGLCPWVSIIIRFSLCSAWQRTPYGPHTLLSVASFITLLQQCEPRSLLYCCNNVNWGNCWVTLLQQWPQIILLQLTLDTTVVFVLPLVTLLTQLPVMWHKEHLWNFCVLQRVQLSGPVVVVITHWVTWLATLEMYIVQCELRGLQNK
jgi:hypothetical protein